LSSTTRIRFAIRSPAYHLGPCRSLYARKGTLTIIRQAPSPATDPQALALSALGWIVGQPERAERLLSLTGLSPEALREGLGDPAVLGAVIEFLRAHEPDLIAAAEAIGIEPGELASVAERLIS